MSAIQEPLVIEITEDAYKQNAVYRPWDDINASRSALGTGAALTQQKAAKVPATVSRGLAAARICGQDNRLYRQLLQTLPSNAA